MLLLLILLVVLLVAYISLLCFYYLSWSSISDETGVTGDRPFLLSIIIAARNEQGSIRDCLKSVLEQDYDADFEVVLVDDHSEDLTFEIAESLKTDYDNLKVVRLEDDLSGKKAALKTGIATARGDVFVFTDADCRAGRHWLDSLAKSFVGLTQAVTAPVITDQWDTDAERYQCLDLLSLSMVTAGGNASGIHTLGNGANLAVRRSAYEQIAEDIPGMKYVSGDDLFLVQRLKERFGNESIATLRSVDATVVTSPLSNFVDLLEQRMRWASKNVALPEQVINRIWGFIWIVNFSMLLAPLIFLILNISLVIFGALWLMKGAAEYLILRSLARYYGLNDAMRNFPLTFLSNMVFISILGALVRGRSEFDWKGRRQRA